MKWRKAWRLAKRLRRHGPFKLMGRWLKKSVVRKRTRRPVRVRDIPRGRPGIVPGKTLVEWLSHPELGYGKVLAWMPGNTLDVEFEAGGRPPYGVPAEDVRILA